MPNKRRRSPPSVGTTAGLVGRLPHVGRSAERYDGLPHILPARLGRTDHESLSLEDEFWNAFREIARGRDMSVSDLVGEIDSDRQHANLSSAVRLFVLDFYREQYANYHSRTRKELVA